MRTTMASIDTLPSSTPAPTTHRCCTMMFSRRTAGPHVPQPYHRHQHNCSPFCTSLFRRLTSTKELPREQDPNPSRKQCSRSDEDETTAPVWLQHPCVFR